MERNIELDLAWDFVNYTDRNIFLTGKAGTGKTTFLHKLKMKSFKRMVVVAPTGVAAINAKGVTIHSFFQLPFGPILPNEVLNNNSNFNRKFSKTKIDIIKSLDLLVIDEISMVRADVLDGIDKTLRRFKNRNKVFGGVQLLMIGDLQQLSPVVKDNEWQLLRNHYNNAFFFSSNSYKECNAIAIELKHIYRQDNPKFITILNEIRVNRLTLESANELNKRYQPNFIPDDQSGYITLTTHNNRAEQVNIEKLDGLKTKTLSYNAVVEGKFPEYAYPNKEELVLKVGAQVMFIKNDSSPEKRYFNGKIGKVILLDEDEVVVHCPDDDFNIIVVPETWENINYTIDAKTNAISENIIGTYTQIPLRLAWAITIHKSQGLTFEKVIIDTKAAFAHGQTYVALSRCKSLEGLVLKSKIDSNQIINDQNVLTFNENAERNPPDNEALLESKSTFQLNLIAQMFDFYGFLYPINRLLDIYYKNRNSIEGNLEEHLNTIKEGVTNLLKIANSFQKQLQTLVEPLEEPQLNKVVQDRFIKAVNYFREQTETTINAPFKLSGFTTDNKAIEKDIDKFFEDIDQQLQAKLLYFKGLSTEFNVSQFLELNAKSVFLDKKKTKTARTPVISETTNIELFELLRALRNDIAETEDVIHYQIFTQKALYEMCETLPLTKQELIGVKGMGKVRVEKYGEAILGVIKDFCEKNGIEGSPNSDSFEKPKKPNTKKVSLELFLSGKSIDAIAKERDLVHDTIFGHLSHYIPTGEVKITDLMSKERYQEFKEIIPEKTFESLSDLKAQLDDKYSYSELRLMVNEFNN
ncbi:helix-turn-helix domain-containing protein [Aestuariivivens insulae]|uniref:helix-turn-helix domain-containing protein n=1 Tax=Aestuariivivens insulae TaxID=1621988 RepID=UPI001F5963EF|nr:helix-turn-helix domain-containing protein [Aestuariivivens insulae]